MISLLSVEIRGTSGAGAFAGRLEFGPGLNLFTANNTYGKSLAITAIPWCLGLEPMFGLQDNDTSQFPLAVREAVELDGVEANVIASEARLTLTRGSDNAQLTIRRPIAGGDPGVVEITETSRDGEVRVSLLNARKYTMADATGGLENFLYSWCSIVRAPLMTYRGVKAELYLENLAPLFYIDQGEGWTDIQALQVHRYGLQEIGDAAVECLLGAHQALEQRLRRQEGMSVDARHKLEAVRIAARVDELFKSQGWTIAWSTHGQPAEIASRWAMRSLASTVANDMGFRPDDKLANIDKKIRTLQRRLVTGSSRSEGDGGEASPAGRASQEVVELKSRRHDRRSELREARTQLAAQAELLTSLEHQLESSQDVLRLKATGIGRLSRVECPTCHRFLSASTFRLSTQSANEVEQHILALRRQRRLIQQNVESLRSECRRLQHAVDETSARLQEATRALEVINMAVGEEREELARVANQLAALEKERAAVENFKRTIGTLDAEISEWVFSVRRDVALPSASSDDLRHRVTAFEAKLRDQLIALGHSAINANNAGDVHVDERYTPYLGRRRIRSLGSASDHPRLVIAYALALAEASRICGGQHPGFVVLDEPKQQNPDDPHVALFLQFLAEAASRTKEQIIITTFLKPEECSALVASKVPVTRLSGDKFLAPAADKIK